MNKLIRKVIKRLRYELWKLEHKDQTVSKTATEETQAPLNVFDLVIQDMLSKREDIFFIQVGAHDGLQFDPIRPYVKRHHWQGILIEPQPHIFRNLLENYLDESQLIFENAALAHEDGKVTLYTFEESAELPEHATMLASLKRSSLEYNGHGYKAPIQETIVAAVSVPTLLAKHKVAKIDLLQIDTEGFDAEIIKMFDLDKFKPTFIHFESGALPPDEMSRCSKRLAGYGYRLLTVGIDTLAYQQEVDIEFVEAHEKAAQGREKCV